MNTDLKKLSSPSKNIIYIVAVVGSLVLGSGSGYLLANNSPVKPTAAGQTTATVKNAQSDNQTFRDFAEGTVTKRTKSSTYDEGTELLVRDGASPVALTSSVVDLSQYEGKKVKVYGETQKALKEGWLMDVGRVEVQ